MDLSIFVDSDSDLVSVTQTQTQSQTMGLGVIRLETGKKGEKHASLATFIVPT